MEHVSPKVDWMGLITAFLHDPPDKAMDIRGHESRALHYLEVATQSLLQRKQIKVVADIDASVAERLPMPTAGAKGERAVGPENNSLLIYHPLAGNKIDLQVGPVERETVARCIEELIKGIDEPQRLFLSLWRLLPERLAKFDPFYLRLPADTRVPDHTIWNHLDATAALQPAEHGGGVAFLSFVLGPVQEFIAAAKSVRDLWSGSMLLSWITFRAMIPVLETCGPTALLYPSMRGLPWVDHWLREKYSLGDLVGLPVETALRVPSLPNRFLSVVPAGISKELALQCETAARSAWKDIAGHVHSMVNGKFTSLPGGDGWAKRWDEQISGFFSFKTSVFFRRDCEENQIENILGRKIAPEARKLADLIPKSDRPRFDQRSAGNWQAMVDYSARLMEAQRAVRHVPPSPTASADERFPKKCSLLGSYEQMGPDDLARSNDFWGQASEGPLGGVHVRPGERLCAVSLVKRFCEPAFFKSKFKLGEKSFEDTATIAARCWLEKARIDHAAYPEWSGQWLHWVRRDSEKDAPVPDILWKKLIEQKNPDRGPGAPPTYYAILMLDGDQMGKWLSGENAPAIKDIMHPKLVSYFSGLGEKAEAAMAGRRPVGPAMHAAISQALANFAVHVVPTVVRKHKGTLIYSGGDDVLALLPVETAMPCAFELYRAFRGEGGGGSNGGYFRVNDRDLLMMGSEATLSGGLAVVHYKSDLHRSLEAARGAEKDAKRKGRDALVVKACRRSGEHTSVFCPWSFIPRVEGLVEAFTRGASDRFAYHLAAERQTLQGLPPEAQRAELKRQIQRSEPESREKLTGFKDKQQAGAKMVELFGEYSDALGKKGENRHELLSRFIDLLQTASFLARGRE